MERMPLPETVERVAKAMSRHTEMPFDETTDDMTVQFAIKLADADERIKKLTDALVWVRANLGAHPENIRRVVEPALARRS